MMNITKETMLVSGLTVLSSGAMMLLESPRLWMYGVHEDLEAVEIQVLEEAEDPEVKQMTWNASGPAIPKAISCAEIMKRKNKSLHQITKLTNKRIEEYWEPTVDGLDRLKVNRDIPAIHILLSKIPVDTSDPGYQAPGSVDTLWTASKSQQSSSTPHKHSQDSRQQGSVAGQRQRKRKHQKDNKNNSDKT